jgi:aspartate ammonia-lyase
VEALMRRSLMLVTALNPHIGYERSTELAAEAMRTGKGIVELVREQGVLSEAQIRSILDPSSMTVAPTRKRAR